MLLLVQKKNSSFKNKFVVAGSSANLNGDQLSHNLFMVGEASRRMKNFFMDEIGDFRLFLVSIF